MKLYPRVFIRIGEFMKNPWNDDELPKSEDKNSKVFDFSLEKLFSSFNLNFRKDNSGKDNPKKFGLYTALSILFLMFLSTGFFKVDYDQKGVILRFGEWNRTVGSGLQYKLPYPFEQVILCRVTKVNQIDIGINSDTGSENLVLTGDSNLANFSYSVLWKIKDEKVEDFLFNAKRPETTIVAVAESVMREIIGQSDFAYVQTDGRAEIQKKALKNIQAILDEYKLGVEIVKVSLRKVEPPLSVIDSFRDVERAQADQQSECNKAEGYSRDTRARTRGLVAEKINYAEAKKASLIAQAKGEIARFNSSYESYKLAPEIISENMRLNASKGIYSNAKKLVIDKDVKSLQHMSIPQSYLNAKIGD